MKKALLVLLVFVCGCAVGWQRPKLAVPAHAQQVSTTLQCQIVGPCAQYILQVNSGRGMGRFQIYPVTDIAIPTSGSAPYSGKPAVSVQFFEPDPRGSQTFTLSVSEP